MPYATGFGAQCERINTLVRWDLWQPGLGVVDITNPDARKWYVEKLDALIELGVDTFKVWFLAKSSCTTTALTGRFSCPTFRPILVNEFHMQMLLSMTDQTPFACITRIRCYTTNWFSICSRSGLGKAKL